MKWPEYSQGTRSEVEYTRTEIACVQGDLGIAVVWVDGFDVIHCCVLA